MTVSGLRSRIDGVSATHRVERQSMHEMTRGRGDAHDIAATFQSCHAAGRDDRGGSFPM
ncbi:hypothetical protein [Komagataeibacter saccharivorans]|uniref:hypothetical protein n=1 Tax=Komagataeibacter saccharivorans TaxID=265959 RepID=UPI001404CF60|nr:hypothetical protein [Komagataeibacter saccharivorans]